MKENILHISYKQYRLDEPLPDGMTEVIEAAREARNTSYSPYSGFKVGAAARLESGSIITASNQESSSFPASICAEHNLLTHHNTHMPHDPIVMLAVISSDGENECCPCGVCRQVLADTETRQKREIKIAMCSETTATVVNGASALLPFTFKFNPTEE
ncbi:MAG: cytidine deaminase [Tidjanibacter sp.]|nr:cytidine deaminase [Tidjanibacter sp.]